MYLVLVLLKKKYNDRLDLKKIKKKSTNNLTDIYAVMQSFESLQPHFNLEGVIYTEEDWYLFNRGNGSSGKTSFYLHAQNSIKSLA
jgi:hypothetical protein